MRAFEIPAKTWGLFKVIERIRSSVWARLGARALVLVVGLVALAWVGRGTIAPPAQASSPPDAGAAPVELPAASVTAAPIVVPVAPSAPPAPSGHARATPEDPVFLNIAGPDDLRRLPGVGVKRADAIVALRQRLGHFQRVEELLRVKGVGRNTLRKWRPLLRLDKPSADAGAS